MRQFYFSFSCLRRICSKRSVTIGVLLYAMLLISGCKTYYPFSIDVLEPASEDLHLSHDQITLVLPSEFTLPNQLEQARYAREIIRGLSNVLDYSPALSIDTVIIANMNNKHTREKIIQRIIAQNPDTERYYLLMNPLNVSGQFTYSYNDSYNLYFIDYQYTNIISYHLFDGVTKQAVDISVLPDTLVEQYYWNQSIEAVKPDKQYQYGLARNNAEKYALRIAPRWVSAPRYIYASGEGNLELIQGARKWKKGKTKQAAELWERALKNENPVVVARASYNLALFYEMQDKLEMALDYAAKAYNLTQKKHFQRYVQLLEKRIKQNKRLLYQLP